MTTPAFHDPRLTEQRNPRTHMIDVASSQEIVDLLNAEDATVAAAVHSQRVSLARAIDLVLAAFQAGGRLLYIGAGTSGRLGVLDASECPPTFGSSPSQVVGIIAGGVPALTKSAEGAEDDANAGRAAGDGAGGAHRDGVRRPRPRPGPRGDRGGGWKCEGRRRDGPGRRRCRRGPRQAYGRRGLGSQSRRRPSRNPQSVTGTPGTLAVGLMS